MSRMSKLISCPECGYEETETWDIRAHPTLNEAIRRRKCKECGHRFKTVERVVDEPLVEITRKLKRCFSGALIQ